VKPDRPLRAMLRLEAITVRRSSQSASLSISFMIPVTVKIKTHGSPVTLLCTEFDASVSVDYDDAAAEAVCDTLMVTVRNVAPAVLPGADVVVDAILAKRNLGTSLEDAPLVIGVGPGFEAGKDVHYAVESKRGHSLGRLLLRGSPAPNTGQPGPVLGITSDRVLRAPVDGLWESDAEIGDSVKKGQRLGSVSGEPVEALIDGVLRGLIRSGIRVGKGLKIGDIDPRGFRENCFTISDKALAIAGGVLEGILRFLKDSR